MSSYIEKNKKTKASIHAALLHMLTEKAFDSVTVGDIAKQAGINRGTFYLHYLDKFDLLDQIEQQLFETLGAHIDELHANYSSTVTFERGQEQLASALFRSIQVQAPMLKIFLSDRGRAGFHIRLRNAFAEKVRHHLLQSDNVRQYLHVPIDYFVSFITSAFLGLIEQWVQNDFDKTPEQMTELYIDIIVFIKQ
ncbi:MAG: TetR/AcrR family transcriptional regulator [Caryophanon sp.]|nr:TetR/AcrR family transcriptional regulator [Caryophanon sp.]